ncbi:MAG: alpha-amylase [bacterium]|nr:alpha-amylase [bacterium]
MRRGFVGSTVPVLALLGFALLLAGCDKQEGNAPPPAPVTGGGDLQAQGPTHWWNDQVFYEVFVRSFHDSDGDGFGDLQGLIGKLDYLNDGDPQTTDDLGVTALWLMPVAESPSYHGYDATDYRRIEPDYGTNADFQQLMSEAHARGMMVIVDYVMNHCSNSHPWFTASEANDPTYADWFDWRGDNPGWQQPWGGGSVWHGGDRGYYYGVFWSGMPDLNYANPAVEAEMFDTATWWLQDMGADGFRLDAVKYLMEDGAVIDNAPSTFSFWSRFRAHLDVVAPDAVLVGEAWDNTSVVLQYIDAGLHTCFEFDLAESMLVAAGTGSPGDLAAKIETVANGYPFQQYCTFLTNHDQNRVFDRLGRSEGANKIAAAILLTAPGVPFLYYGEEVGMVGYGRHENIRTPMQWTPGANAGFTTGSPWNTISTNYALWNVETLASDPNSLWNTYRALVQARAASVALRRGTYHALEASNGAVYAFLRRYLGSGYDDAVIAVHNLGSGTVAGFSLSVDESQLSPGLYTATDLVGGADLGSLAVAKDGAISGWSPVAHLAGYGSLLVNLVPAGGK